MGAETRHRRVAELAKRQHGVVSRKQLESLGVGRGSIRRQLRAGRLSRVYDGVYAVGQIRLPLRGRWTAAVLACGDEAVLSHWSSAALWGLLANRSRLPHVSTPRNRHRRSGIILHRVSLHAEERATRDGIPVTSIPRTLLDLAAGEADRDLLGGTLEEADRLHLLELKKVEDLLRRRRGQPGSRRLARVLAEHHEPPPARSELERRFLRLCADAGLPAPSVNVLVEGLEVDAFWPKQRLVVEVDGFAHHRSRSAFEADRARDVRLRLAGYEVLRFTYRQVVSDPLRVATAVGALLRPQAPRRPK
jgi:predicted transcriptional regulator of viral defense system